VQGWTLGPEDYFKVRLLYQAALDAGKYQNAYASTNPNEYFAEGTQAYFLSGERNGEQDRDWLREYDPELFSLLHRIYGR
jgi:Mlc titration factor MtfA (ptsG expression regulator)